MPSAPRVPHKWLPRRHYPIWNGAIAHAPVRRQEYGDPTKRIGKRALADRPSPHLPGRVGDKLRYYPLFTGPTTGCRVPTRSMCRDADPHERPTATGRAPEDLGVAVPCLL